MARAGDTEITLEAAPSGWRVGDEISIVPAGPPSIGEEAWTGFELRKITAIDGAVISLNESRALDHPTAADPFMGVVRTAEVLNLTRNVRIEATGNGSAEPSRLRK